MISVLWIINNGYTAINHDELTALVAHRVRNDTSSIDGVIVGGCYFHSDSFDNFFLWPLTYIPIRLANFPAFEALHAAWQQFAGDFMSSVVFGGPDLLRGPVVDTEFEFERTTYVRPAPPIGRSSDFFTQGRPRKNSKGLTKCPPVALTFPGLSQSEWNKFRSYFTMEPGLCGHYQAWLRHEQEGRQKGRPLRPFVRIPITFDDWQKWRIEGNRPTETQSIYEYTNDLFQKRLKATIATGREMKYGSPTPSRYVLVVTEEIGTDKANDLSHIAKVSQRVDGNCDLKPLVEDLRIFHEHAVALASSYGVAEEIDSVMWIRDRRYAWA